MNRRQWLQRGSALAAGAFGAAAGVPTAMAQAAASTPNPVGAAVAKPLEGQMLASGLLFPEGPIAMADGSVVVVELAADRLTRIDAQGQKTTLAHLPGGPNGAAVGPDGHFYICLSGGLEWKTENGHTFSTGPAKNYKHGAIQRVNSQTGAVETLYTHCDGTPLRAPNDLVFDAQGGFWFTDLGKTVGDVVYRGGVYYAKADGSGITRVAGGIARANGIGFSPDGQHLYVAEYETSRLWRYAVEAPGRIQRAAGSPNGAQFVRGLGGLSHFDSLAVEAGGNVCVATVMAGGITVIAPDGQVLEFHKAPEAFCSNIAFGGADMRDAFVTLSAYGNVFQARWPRAGLRLQA